MERRLGYNTVLKTMLILLKKGMVGRDESERSHLYRATGQEQEIQANLLRDLLQRAFGGAGREFVLAAIKEAPLLPGDTAEIKDFSILKSRSNTVNNLRAFSRRPIGTGAQVQVKGPETFSAEAINISMGGLLLSPAPSLPAGVPCVLSLAFGPAGNGVELKGTVARSDERGTAIRFSKTLEEGIYSSIVDSFSTREDYPRFTA